MAFIARHQVVGARRISAFNKDVVRGIGCYLRQVGRNDNARMVLDQLKQLLPEAPCSTDHPVKGERRVAV
jgi:hypothetical protein